MTRIDCGHYLVGGQVLLPGKKRIRDLDALVRWIDAVFPQAINDGVSAMHFSIHLMIQD